MYTFDEYRKKYCGSFCSRDKARKMWNQYLEVEISEATAYNKSEHLTIEDFVKAKTILEKSKSYMNTNYAVTIPSGTWDISTNYVSFAPIPQQACTVPCAKSAYNEPQKKEKTMYVDNDKHIESSKINYLSNRVDSVFYKKADDLPRQFGLSDDAAPRSVSDFIKRIQDGKFTIKDESKKDTEGYYYKPLEGIRWRDPSVKEDIAGHKVAMESLGAAYQDAKDTIAIGTPAEGLAAVKALDAWTPTAGNA